MESKQRKSFAIKDVIGIILSVGFLVIVAQNIRYELLVENFAKMNFWAFAICLLLHATQTTLLGLRWTLLFKSSKVAQSFNAIPSYWVGNFYNNILPGRLGDIVKAWHFSTKHAIPFNNAFAGVIAEKILDVQALGFFSCLYLLFFNLHIPVVSWVAFVCVSIVCIADVFLLLFIRQHRFAKKMLGFIPLQRFRKWLYRFFLLTSEKLTILFRTKDALLFMEGSIGVYLVGVLTTYLLFNATGLEHDFASLSICIAFPIFFLVIHFIPSAPSSVGVVHYGIYKALLFLATYKGLSITPALENQIIFSTLLFHFVYFLPETIIGLFFVIRERRLLFSIHGVQSFLLKSDPKEGKP